jgi:hypothetical protein
MLEFCPQCGEIGGLQRQGQSLICSRCGREAGLVPVAPERVLVNQADEMVRQGTAAHCPVCRQLVDLRGERLARHFDPAGPRRLCAGSGQSIGTLTPGEPAARASAQPQDSGSTLARNAGSPGMNPRLAAHMTRELIRVVSCRENAVPQIEELSLAYLDKADRVRVQIDALRDILGPSFQMRDYPPALARPRLTVWSSAGMCVVGKRHDHGGYQPMSDVELAAVVADLQQHTALFFH